MADKEACELVAVADADGIWLPGRVSVRCRWRVKWVPVEQVTDGPYLVRIRGDSAGEYLRRVYVRDGWLHLYALDGSLHGRLLRWEIESARRVLGVERS